MDVREREREPYRVLVLPGGTEIGLEVAASLGYCKEVVLYSGSMNVPTHAPFAYRRHLTVPGVAEDGWLQALVSIIESHAIDVVIPAHDDVVLALAEAGDAIPSRILCPPLETCRITRLKSLTYDRLGDTVPVPHVYAAVDDVGAFPVFVKPDRSQGSSGARVVRNRTALACAIDEGSDLIMEYLPGREHTVDCFSDRDRGLLFCRGRERVRTRAGISMRSRSDHSPLFDDYARRITGRLDLRGAWFFQVREDAEGVPRLLEVGPRIAGTMALHRVLGLNFALLAIYEELRIPITVMLNDLDIDIDRALVNRYRHDLRYSAVYVDLDDTLIVRGDVNTMLVAFLYQCVNAGRRIVLLTRHAHDVNATLRHHRLAGLFDQVVHLTQGEAKADHISEPDAILIDDSFRERAVAQGALGVATFDCSMLEMLLDTRV